MTPDAPSLVGRTIAHYRVLQRIGAGATAVVYLADDLRHGRRVALKVLRPDLAKAIGQERFLREVATTANLLHPHILPLYDSGLWETPDAQGGLPYYVMPYVEGESLRARLDREKQIEVEDAVRIAREVAEALEYAHGRGVIHRDIKPDNILLVSGHAVVADFGIARAMNAAGGDRLTSTGVVIGTPAYMSPEQAGGEDEVDGRSDVYAVGCVLYEMLTGQPPFTGRSVDRLVHQHLAVDPQPVTNLRPSVPPELAATVSRALAKVPADRFATAERLAAALTTVPVAAAPARTAAWRGVRSAWLVGAGAIAVLAVGTALWPRGTPAPDPTAEPRIVVLPFAPVSPDTALQRIGREVVVAIAANLDGMGELRTVDASTALAGSRPETAMPLSEAHHLATRLGAARLVHGTLTHAAAGVRLDAALYDVGAAEPIARASVTEDGIEALGDAATIALLDQIWQVDPPLTGSLAAVTRSVVPEARRSYLAGELALYRSQMQAAIDAYERAFAQDTTFWWAYWRSLYPRSHRETTQADPALIQKVVDHRHELDEPDRLLVEAARMNDGLLDQLEQLRLLTDRFPSFEPAWWEYANRILHFGAYAGHGADVGRAALDRVLSLNDRFTTAWDHLAWLAIMEGDSATALRAAREMGRLAGPTTLDGLVPSMRVSFFDSPVPTPARLDSLVDLILRMPPAFAPMIASGAIAGDGFPESQIVVNRALRTRSPTPALSAALWQGEALAWAARGAWDSALVAADRMTLVPGAAEPGLVAYRLTVAGVVSGALPAEQARRRRPAAAPDNAPDLYWLDGVLAYAERDRDGIARARRALTTLPAVTAGDSIRLALLDRSLGALGLDAAGDRPRAARELVALETEIADRFWIAFIAERNPSLTVVHRILAGRWLRALGQDAEAYRMLAWFEALTIGASGPWSRAIGNITLLDRAEIAEAGGDMRRAARDLARFLDWYDLPDDAVLPLVARARAGLERVMRESG